MPTHCSAYGCSNSSGKESCRNNGISFHKFPLADKKLLGQWLVNVRRADFVPSPYSYICSDHFNEEDFEYQSFTNRRGLKKGVVPTRFSYSALKSGLRRKKGTLRKNKNPELYNDNTTGEPAFTLDNKESNEVQMNTYALVEVFMNEKFYAPNRLEALVKDLQKSTKSKQKNSHNLGERIVALKETLHAKILLRSLKKQLLNAEIKAANAKRNYYEAKKAMLSQTSDEVDLDGDSDSETDSPLQNIQTRLKEEELAAQIEERMLQEQLEEMQVHAVNNKKEYDEAKSSMESHS